MKPIYLERHESDKNLHRFYQLHVTPGIFEDWALVREWGRVNSPGTVRKDWFATEDEAIAAGEVFRVNKEKNGYRTVLAILTAMTSLTSPGVFSRLAFYINMDIIFP